MKKVFWLLAALLPLMMACSNEDIPVPEPEPVPETGIIIEEPEIDETCLEGTWKCLISSRGDLIGGDTRITVAQDWSVSVSSQTLNLLKNVSRVTIEDNKLIFSSNNPNDPDYYKVEFACILLNETSMLFKYPDEHEAIVFIFQK